MPIKIRPTGLTGLYGQLGQLAGEAQQARRDEEQARVMERQILGYQQEREMVQFRAELELETRKQAEIRAKQWELEKMQIASQMDFTREEQRRQKKLDERQSKLDALERAFKEGTIDEDDYQAAYLQEVTDIPFYMQTQIAERARERPTTARVPSESQYAYLSSQGYSDKDIREMFDLAAPGATAGERLTYAQWKRTNPEGTAREYLDYYENITQPTTTPTEPIPTIRSDADYNALPSGTTFFDPTGQLRTKP